MAGQVIEEYLTALGFRIDESSWGKFNLFVARGTMAATRLGLATAGAAASVAIAVGKIAQEYNNLYYVSQRTQGSVEGLRGIGFGFERIGLSAAQATQQAETFAQKMRTNPGIAALARGMGVDANDPTKGLPQLVERLKQQFGEKGYFGAAAIAGEVFGIDEPTFRQQWNNLEKLKAAQADYARRTREAGINQQEFARKSTEFVDATNNALTSMNMILLQTGDKWLPTMTGALGLLDALGVGLAKVGKDTDGWTSTVISLVAALGGLRAAAFALSFIPGMGKLAGMIAGGSGAALRFASPAMLAGGVLAAGYAARGTPEGKAYKATGDVGTDLPNYMRAIKPTLQRWLGVGGTEGATGDAKERTVAFFMSQGYSREQAIGMAASLHRESRLDPAAYNPAGGGNGARGIGQWRGKRQEDFKRLFGKELSNSTLEEQLAFHQWELTNSEAGAGSAIRGAKSAREAATLHSRLFERHGNPGEDAARGALADKWFNTGGLTGAGGAQVSISQKTEITVNGAGDPNATAAAITSGQDRVNGDLVRNTKGAVR